MFDNNVSNEPSQWGNLSRDPNIYLEISDATLSTASNEINISIINNSDLEYTFLEEVYLEIKSDQNWYQKARIYETMEMACILAPNSSLEWKMPLQIDDTLEIADTREIEGADGVLIDRAALVPGTYRLVIKLYQDGKLCLIFKEFDIDD
ncbi:immunoglobulin-like domain-containing protein [Robinsoniella peoriensis]